MSAWAKTRFAKYRKTHPWVRLVEHARRRCKDKSSKWFQFYGAKGIECRLDAADAKFLWERDRADQLKKPSLDRKDSSLDYTRDNCRIIEFVDNSRMAWDESFRFLYNEGEPERPTSPDVAAPTVNLE